MILKPNTISYPRTMVIHSKHTLLASLTMMWSRRL